MTHLPSGTVTFALAAVPVVEGSGVALLVDRHRGYLFAQDADGWSAAFSSPVDALAAAAQAVWTCSHPKRSRISLARPPDGAAAEALEAFPGGALVLFALGWTLMGDALRDALDPRSRP